MPQLSLTFSRFNFFHLILYQASSSESQIFEDLEPDCEASDQDRVIGIMGDTAKRFSSLLTVICRTAKRSANKMAKIRKKKSGGEEINKLSTTSEDVGSPCKARSTNKPGTSEDEKGDIIFHS